MTLKILNGEDIFDPKFNNTARVIVQGCNAQGSMRSGIAKTIADYFPNVYVDYYKRYQTYGLNLGNVISTKIDDYLTICSAITQKYYGRNKSIVYVDYDAVKHSLQKVAAIYGNDREIHIPYIGGGLANGDRAILLEIYKEALHGTDATLFIKD